MRKEKMTASERFHALMRFESFDRMPVIEWALWWDKTLRRWHSEKLPSSLTDTYEICEHFGLDLYKQKWINHFIPGMEADIHGGKGMFESNDPEMEYATLRRKILPLENRGLSRADKELFSKRQREKELGNTVIWFTIEGFFWFPRSLFGIENHLLAFYDYPELMHRINSDLADWHIRVIESICRFCKPDFMTFAEDMSYNLGMMISEDLFNGFILPYYRKVIPCLKAYGIIPFIDSDGDIADGLPWFRNAGIEGVLPLERQAGTDLNTIRKTHPNTLFIGHYDKRVMNRGTKAMEEEFERLVPQVKHGGYIVSVDHQTPPEVSYNQYKDYIRLLKEYAWKCGR